MLSLVSTSQRSPFSHLRPTVAPNLTAPSFRIHTRAPLLQKDSRIHKNRWARPFIPNYRTFSLASNVAVAQEAVPESTAVVIDAAKKMKEKKPKVSRKRVKAPNPALTAVYSLDDLPPVPEMEAPQALETEGMEETTEVSELEENIFDRQNNFDLPDPQTFISRIEALSTAPSNRRINSAEDIGKEQLRLMNKQFELETAAIAQAVQKYEEILKELDRMGKSPCLKPTTNQMRKWYSELKNAIEQRLQQINEPDGEYSEEVVPNGQEIAAFLLGMKSDKLAVIAMHTTVGMVVAAPRGVTVTRVTMQIGRTVQAEANLKELKDMKRYKWLKKQGRANNVRHVNRYADYVLEGIGTWPDHIVAGIGGLLLEAFLRVCVLSPGDLAAARVSLGTRDHTEAGGSGNAGPFELNFDGEEPRRFIRLAREKGDNIVPEIEEETEAVDENAPPIYGIQYLLTQRGWQGSRNTIGVLSAAPEFIEIVRAGEAEMLEFIAPSAPPMLIPPNPWKGVRSGVYLTRQSTMMRTKGFRVHINVLHQHGGGHEGLRSVFRALDTLGSTAWRVNKRVYAVLAKVWDTGEQVADLPSRKDIPIPSEPPKTDPERRYEWIKVARKIKRHNQDLHSLRSDTVLKLGVAKQFINEKFYFPHNLDFRGRTYPIPPHLNHLGSDMTRSMLVFGTAKRLGPRGFDWIKVHLANLYGKDKIPIEERIAFTETNMDNILESANDPLGSKRWWLNAENPWQCLGCCFEIADIVRSGSPADYMSALPVHQDGTCNGLQHYAALGGDVYGAREVNLLPSDRPQDVYNGVAQLVRKRIDQDAAEGERIASLLVGKVDRKIVKQVVMTSVYGVTFTGARKQISNAMKDRNNLDISDEDVWAASYYLTKHTFASLGEIFNGARAIMDWLARAAREIAKRGNPVMWKTPLGLPIVQPYKKENGSRDYVKTMVQTVCLKTDKEQLAINPGKNKAAFPPNYIHSLDSSHMMLTANRMADLCLDFAAVHDSYWTHAASVSDMGTVLREQFVKLHQRPLLQELVECFNEFYPGVYFEPLPQRGELDVSEVLKSRYFFN